MRNASALSRFVAPMIAVGVLMAGCGQAPQTPDAATGSTVPPQAPRHRSRPPSSSPKAAAAPGNQRPPPWPRRRANRLLPAQPVRHSWPPSRIRPPWRPGPSTRTPQTAGTKSLWPDIRRTAVLIGDSQSEPADGWPRQGLAAIGYNVFFCGRGGTGFVASNGKTGNYIDALQRGDWQLPYGITGARGHPGRRERCRTRSHGRPDRGQRRTPDLVAEAALSGGQVRHDRHAGPRRQLRRRPPDRGGCPARHGGGQALDSRSSAWATG